MDLDLDFGGIRYHYNETIHLQKHQFHQLMMMIPCLNPNQLVEIGFMSVGLPYRNSTGVTIENDREHLVTNISTGKHALTPQSHRWHHMVKPLCSVG
jgi:hypothetical protein